MESIDEELSERQKQEAAIRLLRKLGEQLQSADASTRRRAAYNLSWMQEDGLQILKGVLFGNFQVTAKNASAYGLRKMRGRMKKQALEIFKKGLKHRNSSTRDVCSHALEMMGEAGAKPPKKKAATKRKIQDIPGKRKPKRKVALQQTNWNR